MAAICVYTTLKVRNIEFLKTIEEELFVYRLYYDRIYYPLVERSWNGLDYDMFYKDETKSPHNNFGMSNGLREDNIIYSSILWRLLKGKNSFGIPNYYKNAPWKTLLKDFDFILWEYDIEYDNYMTRPKDNGFVKGRSCILLYREPNEWQSKHKDYAGLFKIGTYNDIIGLELAVFGDVSSEISFFGLVNNDKEYLIDKLTDKNRPELKDILNQHDIFINLLIGHDMGYYASLSVYSREDISEQINRVSAEIYSKCIAYEDKVYRINTIDEFINEIKKIIDC